MLKKNLLMILSLLFCATIYAAAPKGITMLIVPRDAKAIQIAQDISDGYPVLLVTYRQNGSALDLHAWNGESWVPVSIESYTNGTFFATAPQHAILIQSDRISVPDVLTPSGAWCQSGNRLVSTDPRALIHLLGRYFDFPYRHWMQMAKRYGYALEQVNPALINVHWWHYRGDELVAKRAQRDLEADADKWYLLEIAPPPVPAVEAQPAMEPAEKAPEAPPAEPAAAPAETKAETVKAPEAATAAEPAKQPAVDADPFSDQEIPAAEVVLPKKI